MQTYTTAALAKISGISRDQLMRWDRGGWLRAARRTNGKKASECAYTREQALGVIALGELRRRGGISDRRIRAAAALLPISIADHAFLVYDGRMIYARASEADVVKTLLESELRCQVLAVKPLAERLS